MAEPCGKQHPERAGVVCDRWAGHGGAHWAGPGHVTQWGGRGGKGTYEPVKPLPADKPLGAYRAPAPPPRRQVRGHPRAGDAQHGR